MPKPLTVWITINYGKFWKRWEYQNTWSASWEICMQVRKQQWELDMEQQTGSKQEKEFVKAVYCLPVYLTSMQSTSWETSPTWWTWVWVNSGSCWWTGRPGMLQFMVSQSRTQLSNWTDWLNNIWCGLSFHLFIFHLYIFSGKDSYLWLVLNWVAYFLIVQF